MIKFFKYNWQVRDEWFSWCNQLSMKELLKDRTGGVGNILYTLFHIIDVEYSWLRAIQGKEDMVFNFENYKTLEKVKLLSDNLRLEIVELLEEISIDTKRVISVHWDEEKYSIDEVLHHIITHEIHHIGQLFVWARELNLSPVSANYIGRKLNSTD